MLDQPETFQITEDSNPEIWAHLQRPEDWQAAELQAQVTRLQQQVTQLTLKVACSVHGLGDRNIARLREEIAAHEGALIQDAEKLVEHQKQLTDLRHDLTNQEDCSDTIFASHAESLGRHANDLAELANRMTELERSVLCLEVDQGESEKAIGELERRLYSLEYPHDSLSLSLRFPSRRAKAVQVLDVLGVVGIVAGVVIGIGAFLSDGPQRNDFAATGVYVALGGVVAGAVSNLIED